LCSLSLYLTYGSILGGAGHQAGLRSKGSSLGSGIAYRAGQSSCQKYPLPPAGHSRRSYRQAAGNWVRVSREEHDRRIPLTYETENKAKACFDDVYTAPTLQQFTDDEAFQMIEHFINGD